MDYGTMFIKSKGKPITFNSKELILIDKYEVEKNDILNITIESTNSEYIQAIGISEEVEVFGQRVKKPIILESFSIPPEMRDKVKSKLPFEFSIKAIKKGNITIYNMCIIDGIQQWWHNGSCMYSEEIENGKRYYCNDIIGDDDFDDLIFRVNRGNK